MDIGDLKETAALAHLNLDGEELLAAFPAFEEMLGFFAAMQAADGDTAAFPALEEIPAGNGGAPAGPGFFRTDGDPGAAETGGTDRDGQERLLDNAGERDGRFIVVPNVL